MASAIPRTPQQRSLDNAAYRARRVAAGIAHVKVMVPMDRIPEIMAISLAWRQEAKLLLESDRPSADQILQIHAVTRTLGIALPVSAFATRSKAAYWLLAHQQALAIAHANMPKADPLRSTDD